MAKYKNLTPKLIEGFLDKMFGKIATATGQQVAIDMAKKDPKVGKLLKVAADMVKRTEKHLSKMSKSERDKWRSDLEKEFGIK